MPESGVLDSAARAVLKRCDRARTLGDFAGTGGGVLPLRVSLATCSAMASATSCGKPALTAISSARADWRLDV